MATAPKRRYVPQETPAGILHNVSIKASNSAMERSSSHSESHGVKSLIQTLWILMNSQMTSHFEFVLFKVGLAARMPPSLSSSTLKPTCVPVSFCTPYLKKSKKSEI